MLPAPDAELPCLGFRDGNVGAQLIGIGVWAFFLCKVFSLIFTHSSASVGGISGLARP